jgi:hypothetical protein
VDVGIVGDHYVSGYTSVPLAELQELKHYFARPRQVNGGVLPSTRARYLAVDFPCSAWNSVFPNMSTRIMGAYGFRATLVFTLQVAATPFHQGVVVLAWQYGNLSGLRYGYDRGFRSETVTNLPHVRLDLSEQTMVTLRVPYIAPYDFLSTKGEYALQNYGELSLTGLLPPLSTPGATSPTYKVYAHIEDLELFGVSPAASQNITLQMGDVEKEKKQVASKINSCCWSS